MISEAERLTRIRSAILSDMETGSPAWYYLSFADETGFLGACIVNALGYADAMRQSHIAGCNPGGEVSTVKIPDDAPLKDEWKNRLLSFQDMVDMGMEPVKTPREDEEA